MSALDRLPDHYRVILCDIWGCIHDGRQLYAGAAERLRGWRGEGRRIILVSNAPRPGSTVEADLVRIGLEPGDWHEVVTAGDTAIEALKRCDQAVGFIGTRFDRADLEDSGIAIADGGQFRHLACAGLDGERRQVEDYRDELGRLAADAVTMHCLNPDRIVIHAGMEVPCAGALADLYVELGGAVIWYGKPFPAIYKHALALAGDPSISTVVAIGDSLATDVVGAARMGIDCIFVADGIHRGSGFPAGFAADHGLGDWRPLAVVKSLR